MLRDDMFLLVLIEAASAAAATALAFESSVPAGLATLAVCGAWVGFWWWHARQR